ncbi:lanthionine synthetase LanC family protein [Streptomyces sp. NPDC020875]|uniref:lanthionine synthetase LanC family protein n=1 Tax=Streptomyces sp. NPDC020875 TaxID=3154898 RepID=UPI0033CBF2B4
MADAVRQVERTVRAVADADRLVADLGPGRAATLSHGLPGTAVLLATLSAGDPGLARRAEHHWETAARLLRGRAPDGIHSGPGALAASVVVGGAYLRREPAALGPATRWLTARAEGLARHQRRRLDAGGRGAPWGVYDTVKGLSGIGRVLLAARTAGRTAAAPGLTAALTTLTGLIIPSGGGLPGWWLPAEDHRLPLAGGPPPSGAATTGIAHGIAGPLALLSLAAEAGHTVPGQTAAVRTAADWLLTWSDRVHGCPAHISGDALRRPPDARRLAAAPGRRHAWCYGAAGIGAALAHAGRALSDAGLVRAGRDTVAAIGRWPEERWDTEGPGLCHGSAGILQAARRAGTTGLARRALRLTPELLTPEPSASVPSVSAPPGEPGGGTDPADAPGGPAGIGFLGGATGAVCALADAEGLLPAPHTAWDALLLLS